MPNRKSNVSGSELFIIDNSDEAWKALTYLQDWASISDRLDIATGYFEIGSLLALDGDWQKIDSIRILMGDVSSLRTARAFEKALTVITKRLDASVEHQKLKDHFVLGLQAIVAALKSGQIQGKIYRKDKFHAKAYITHSRKPAIDSSALVGSSNMTVPGLTKNIELNVRVSGPPVTVLQEWYDEHWEDAEDINADLIDVLERHIREYSPFEVYAKSLQSYFEHKESSNLEWEQSESVMFPVLDRYQQDGYSALIDKADKFGGAFLCDGVGLGKTFVGLMLIEWFVKREGKNVALFVPKSAKEAVWEKELRKWLPDIFKGYSRLKIFSHTDLTREKMAEELGQVASQADIILIDEAHHFRNTGTKGEDGESKRSRYWKFFDIVDEKKMFFLTATPINNSLIDFQHMVELFTRGKPDHFAKAPLGIHSLAGHIRKLEKQIEKDMGLNTGQAVEINYAEAENTLAADPLFDALVVQRSRKYVKESLRIGDREVLFPKPRAPKVADYNLTQTYGKLLDMVAEAFSRQDPLFTLGIYNPIAYYTGDDPDHMSAMELGRRGQIVALIRTSFLKRFESSVESFRISCWRLMFKLMAWLETHAETEDERARFEIWKRENAKTIGYKPQHNLLDEEDDEDFLPPEILESVEHLDRKDYDIEALIKDSIADLDQIVSFLSELEKFKPSQDKKLQKLLKMLRSDSVLKDNKVIIFTEFGDTAEYLYQQLSAAGVSGLFKIDSNTKGDRAKHIQRFAPYYNSSSSALLEEEGKTEIRVLISTDVLSEGLNLQDATRMINYDIHWNPVRLMQRIGRVDRRMSEDIEKAIIADHPEQKKLRGTVGYWNFLPPGELDSLLRLYNRVSHKTLRISKTLGIEGGKLLTEGDEYDDLKNFDEKRDGTITDEQKLSLEWQEMLANDPALNKTIMDFPNAVFSGKKHPQSDTRAIFFCYNRPGFDTDASREAGEDIWNAKSGDARWYLYDLEREAILESAPAIAEFIRSNKKTKRVLDFQNEALSSIRVKVEKHITKTYLRKVQAPVGVSPTLKTWMELN